MSGCPKGTGRDCGCESGLESESECDPCQGRCGEWQKTPNFVKSLPGRHIDPETQKMLWKGRIIFGSAVGSLLVGGWLYHKYLHYAAAREAAKAKKASRAKPKSVNHERLGVMGPSSTLVPKVKELANVERNNDLGTDDIERPKKVNQELSKSSFETILPSEKKKEVSKEEDKKTVGTEIESPKEFSHELQRKLASDTVTPSGVKKEFTMKDAKKKSEPIRNINKKKDEYLRVKGPSSTLVPKVKELEDVGSNNRIGTEIGRPKETNEELRRKTGTDTAVPSRVRKELTKVDVKKKVEPIENINDVKDELMRVKGPRSILPDVKEFPDVGRSKRVGPEIGNRKEVNEELKKKASSNTGMTSGVKSDLTKMEGKKKIEPIGSSKKVKHDYLKIIVPSTDPRSEVKKETELEVACGGAQEGVKRKTGEGAVITILTEGKNGKKVKRRGWK